MPQSCAIVVAVLPPIVCLFLTKDVRLTTARAPGSGALDQVVTTPRPRIKRKSSRMTRIASRRSLRIEGTATPDELEPFVPRVRTPEYV